VAGPKLDGAGAAKLKTLDEALLLLQRIHSLVEMYAMAVKGRQSGAPLVQNLRRTLPSLAALLKAQFGLIAEQVTALNLSSSRGASEAIRVRTLREGVAQIKQAIEIAAARTRERHTVVEEPTDRRGSSDAT
jgi:hypothetical protein